MVKKLKKNKTQTNYISNRNSLINIEQLNLEIKEAFWSGLIIGSLTVIFATLYLRSDKSAKKETNS